MRIAVCTGAVEENVMLAMLYALNRPLCMATMREEWWEAAAEVGISRFFFKERLALLSFVTSHTILCLHARSVVNGPEVDTLEVALEVMGAIMYPLAPEE